MCVPIRREGQPVGVLSIQSYTPNAYTPEDLRTLQALADHCGGALERIRAEQSLRQREELNRTILATAMDGFYAVDFTADPQGAITEVNEAYCRLTGYSREELLRLRVTDLEAQESPEELAKHKARIIAAGRERFETRHRRKDGQEIHVEVSVTSLSEGGLMFSFIRDITERKRAELAKEAFLSLGAKLSTVSTPLEAARASLRQRRPALEMGQRVAGLYVRLSRGGCRPCSIATSWTGSVAKFPRLNREATLRPGCCGLCGTARN